jgi:serine/threonine-protein kinase PRP4
LDRKFTEIMIGSNKKIIEPSYKDLKGGKIPTDPSKLVEILTKSIDRSGGPSLEIVSSESEESEGFVEADCASPDFAVIDVEDELNLDELMRQKALLQARLGAYQSETDDTDGKDSARKLLQKSKDDKKSSVSDVILLDDSSGEFSAKKKKTAHLSRRDTKSVRTGSNRKDTVIIDRDSPPPSNNQARDGDRSRSRKGDTENRYKEDLRTEIDRDRDREYTRDRDRDRDRDRRADFYRKERDDWDRNRRRDFDRRDDRGGGNWNRDRYH